MYKSNYNFEVGMKQKQSRKLMGVWDKNANSSPQKKEHKTHFPNAKGAKNAPAQLT